MFSQNINRLNKDQLYTLKTLKTPSAGRILARWLMGLFIFFLACMFLPWQQNIRGTGSVTAFTPANRPQTVQSAIAGRITDWKVIEGQYVNAGDTLLTLSEVKDKYFDPELLIRMKEQMVAKEQSLGAKQTKAEALQRQIKALESAQVAKLKQARNKIKQAQYKLQSDSVDYAAEQIRFENNKSQYERNKKLFDAGNISLTKYQDIESKFQESKMKVVSAENKYLQSSAELINARVALSGIEAEYLDKISKSESDLNATLSDLYEGRAALSKLRNETANIQIRNEQYQLVAPQSGFVVKTNKTGIGETIKEGEPVVTIMPQNPDVAVELYVQPMDMPLIAKNRSVRVEFDGWPALQFSGWPSASVGTFGGKVKVIDRVSSKGGLFRILVVPDPDDEPWPNQIRLGSGAKGWVMLDDVPVWYEIWRQLNGFPPRLYEEPSVNDIEGKSKGQSGKK